MPTNTNANAIVKCYCATTKYLQLLIIQMKSYEACYSLLFLLKKTQLDDIREILIIFSPNTSLT